MNPIRFAVLLLTVACFDTAWAAQDARVRRGLEAFDKGYFALARDALVEIVSSPTLSSEDRILARSYLAASYHALGDVASARAQLVVLAREHPDARLDPGIFLPELIALADEARVEVAQEPKPAEKVRPARIPDEPVAPQKLETPKQLVEQKPPDPTPEKPSLALAFVPFGVGQFSLDQDLKGTLFLTGEVVTLGTSAVALAMFESDKTSGSFYRGGTFRDPEKARTLQTIHLVAGYAGLALMVGGVIDALVSRAEMDSGSAGLASTRGQGQSVAFTGQGVRIRF